MSDVLKKYSIVIGADTKELMTELNKAEKELTKKLDNKDLGAGVRESIEKLVKEIGTMRSELRNATKDINNSITAISTDSLKNEFSGLQKIISSDIQGLQTKIEGLQGTIDVLNGTDFSKLETGLSKTLSNVSEQMDKIMGEFKVFHDFTQDLRVGAIDTSALNKGLKNSEVTLKKATKSMKQQFDSLLQGYNADKISNITTVGISKTNIKEAEEFLSIMMNISNAMGKMDTESILSVLDDNALSINKELLDKQIKMIQSDINEFYNNIRDNAKGKSPDIYLRWKTEINPDETAEDIIKKIDENYTNKVQAHLDDKPLKFKTEIDPKDLESAVKNAIKEENNLLKSENAQKIKVGLEIDGLDKSKLDNVANDLSEKVKNIQSGDMNITGGNLNISSDNLAQESTLSDIRDILSTWNGSGVPGTQSKEQIQQNHQTQSNLKNAGYLLRGKFRGGISKDEIDAANLREQLLSEQEWLYGRMGEMKKLRRIGMKRMTKNPDLLKQSDLYNASVEVDGVEYAKWGDGNTTLTEWQAQLDKVIEDGINDYFKDAVKSIEKQLKAKTENLNLLGVEFDKDGKILARNTVAIGQNETYKAAYGKASSLRNQVLNGVVNENGIVENSLQEENDKLQLLKQQRTLMQQIVELATKQESTDLNQEEEEKLNSFKEQLRVITQICSDEVKFNALLKEETELQDKMNSGKLDSKGFDRLMSIRQEMSTMWTDISDDMVEFSRQSLSSTDTQLSQIDNDIAQQQTKVNKIISDFRRGFAQIQRETFSDEIRDDADYERKLKQWKSESQELAVLQNSITNVDSNGKITYDTSALLESERERYWHLNNSVSKLGEQLELYRELKNINAEVTGETEKENEKLIAVKNTASETSKIIASIYSHGAETEQENLSLMSVEELQDLSNKLGNVVDSASTNIDDKLEQKAYQYIDERIKFLENQLSYANERIKYLTEKGGDTSYWEGQKIKLQSDISTLKATQNQAKTEQEIIDSIKTQNKLDDESLAKVREILDLTVEIEKSRERINKLNEIIDTESKSGQNLEISKRKANQERIKENDNFKQLSSTRQQVFDNLPYTVKDDDIISTIRNLLQNGLEGVPDSLITEFVKKKLENAFLQSTVNNVKSTEVTRQSDAQMAASTKERVDAVLKERLEQQQITEEKRKQAELDKKAANKKQNRSATTKNREVNNKYNSRIDELESAIDEHSKVVDEATSNLKKAKNAQDKANKNLKKYESFNKYENEINSNRELISYKQEQLDAEKNNINNLKNRINNLTKVLNDKSFTNGQTEESVKVALERAKSELQEQESKFTELESEYTKDISSLTKEIEEIIAKRSKSRTRYGKNSNVDINTSFDNINSMFELYGSNSFDSKKYADEVLKYMTAGGDYSKLPKETATIISNYINATKEQNTTVVQQAQSIYDSAKRTLEQSKAELQGLNKSKEAEKEAIKLYEAEKKYVETLEQQFAIANTTKSKRTEKSDLFSYTNKNSVSKGMSDKQKMASFKVDYQLDSITKLLNEQEKIKASVGETSNEYLEISKQIDLAKSRLENFRDEAVELGLTISQVTGRAILDNSKESTVLYKDMFTGISEHYTRTTEQERQFRAEINARAKEENRALEEQKELQDRIAAAKRGTAKAEGTIVSEQKKTVNESKFYQGMTEGEAELSKKLFEENGNLLKMYRKKNDYSQEDINNQKDIVEQLKKQVEQSERLELYKSKRGTLNARLKNQQSSISTSTPPSHDLPATEKTLVEIKNILSGKFGVKSTKQSTDKQSSKKQEKGIFNTKGYQEVAKSLGLLQTAKNGNSFVYKKDREKVYAEMDKLGVARFIEEETKATKKNSEAKKVSKKVIENDTSATKKNASEKSKKNKKTENNTNKFNAELYKKIAEENGWLTKKGSVQKDKRDYTYLEMEKQQPGSSGKTKEQLKEIKKELESTKIVQKELNKEQAKDNSATVAKETNEVKQQKNAIEETLNKTQALKYLMSNSTMSKTSAEKTFSLGRFDKVNGKFSVFKSELDDLIFAYNEAEEVVNGVKSNISSPIKDTFQSEMSAKELGVALGSYPNEWLKAYLDGIKASTPEMEEAFKVMAQIPEEIIREVLQINSPSEVMKKLGFWTVEGLVVGITENADKVREALENAIKSGTVSVDELDELSGYSKTRQRNKSYKNIYQGINGLDIESLLASQVNDSQAIIQKLLETSNKALSDSGLSSMFYVDGKAKNQKDAAQYIKENTEEVRVALEEYIRIFAESGLDANKTIDDVFADIFGDKHKTVSNAYSSAIKKVTQEVETASSESSGSVDEKLKKEIQKTFKDYENSLKNLNKVSLSIENGQVNNKNLQERARLTKEVAKLEEKINGYQQQGITNEQAGFDIEERRNKISEQQQIYEQNLLTTKLKYFDVSLAELQNSSNENQVFIQQVNQLSHSISELHNLASQPLLNEEDGKRAKDLTTNIQNTINRLNSLGNAELTSFTDTDSIQQYLNSMSGIERESIKVYDNGTKITGTIKEAGGVSKELKYVWDDVLGCFVKSTAQLTNHVSLWTSLKGQVKKSWNYLKSYFSGYMVAQRVFSELRTGFTYIKELDTALTEMKKVSDESTSSLKNFQKVSFDTAQSIGSTAVEIQNSAADFMRLGYSLQESSQLSKDANIYANVGDMEIDEATEHMISSIQAWQSEFSSTTEASTAIIDKYNEIGNNYAITSADIGSAMERSAAALKVAGNSLDESIGLITAGNLIQQDADTTANALKVMSLRIRGSKTELEDMGEETDGLASSTSKLRNEIKALTGVDIMYDDKTYKSTAKIIQEIGENWEKLDNISQANVLEKLAGKTRASTVAGLIENYEVIGEVAKDAANAQGSALKENAEYMDSIEGKTAQLTSQIQEFWYTLIDSDAIKNGITLLTKLLGKITDFVDKFGALGTAGIIGGGILGAKNIGRPKMFGLVLKYADNYKCSLGY